MDHVRRVALATVCIAGCGAALAQTSTDMPPYEQAFTSVTNGGCERVEADDFIQFKCSESGALWYFSRENDPAYPSYAVGPADQKLGFPVSGGGPLRFSSREAAQASMKARRAWLKDIFATWQMDTSGTPPPKVRDGGKLYRNEK